MPACSLLIELAHAPPPRPTLPITRPEHLNLGYNPDRKMSMYQHVQPELSSHAVYGKAALIAKLYPWRAPASTTSAGDDAATR